MNETTHCPQCGVALPEDAPKGLCPKCLMANALQETETPKPSDIPTITQDPDATQPSHVSVGNLDGDIPAAPEPVGKYSVLAEHGKGGMGRVLLVHDEHLGRDVALKELLPDLGDGSTPTPARHSKEMAARFLREAKITGQLEHPSITPVHEIGRKADGTLYYTMKLVRGRTLSQAIKSAKNFEERLKLLPHFVDLCNAIAYAHSRGVIHRDIKPSNVMIGDYGETVIIDWGLAKIKSEIKSMGDASDPGQKTIMGVRAKTKLDDDSGKTQHGQAMGTPAYMPPEQAIGDLDNIDERSDIYSLGAVLFEILAGEPPVAGNNVAEILRNVIAGNMRSVREVESRCEKSLATIAEKAMSLDPLLRNTTAVDLGEAVLLWKPRSRRSRFVKTVEISLLTLLLLVPTTIYLLNRATGAAVEEKISDLSDQNIVISTEDIVSLRNPDSPTDLRTAMGEVSPQDRLLALSDLNTLMRPQLDHPLLLELLRLFMSMRYTQTTDITPTAPYEWRVVKKDVLQAAVEQERPLLKELKEISEMVPATTGQIRRLAGLGGLIVGRRETAVVHGPPVELLLADAYFALEQGDQNEFLKAVDTTVAIYQHIQDIPTMAALASNYRTANQLLAFTKTFFSQKLISPATTLTALSIIERLFRPESLSLAGRVDRQDFLWAYYHLNEGRMPIVLWEFDIHPESFVEQAVVKLHGSSTLAFVRNLDMLNVLEKIRVITQLESVSYKDYYREVLISREVLSASPYLKPMSYFLDQWHLQKELPTMYWASLSDLERVRIVASVEQFTQDLGRYPDDLENLSPEYLESIPKDLFGRPYIYRIEGESFSLTDEDSIFEKSTFYWFRKGVWDATVKNN